MKDKTHKNIDYEVYEDDLYELDKKSLDEKECLKRVFEIYIYNVYDKKIPNGMNGIHENKVNKIYE